ncbi:hypothetical protein FA13DRAFT_477680 [Coprinellus micaceus]|uniref:G-protein coupled receptors family 1 profile domain-containing protein n=1 Tax=Coprinellus micaceus TaxID=71717 RepID=A0A4Y7TA58_COPMI|nr:hypothetical protein FA13DRAFT_477680 [Coprinellus micaceus]
MLTPEEEDTYVPNPYRGYATIKLVFIVFQMFGLCGTVLMLATVLLGRVPRQATWYNLVFSFLVSTTSYSLLFLSGHWNDKSPPYYLCRAQALLIYASPPYTAATTCGLVVQIYLNLSNTLTGSVDMRRKGWKLVLIFPYVVFIGMIIGCLVATIRNPGIVQRVEDSPYCIFSVVTPSRIASIIVVVLMIIHVTLQVFIFIQLKKGWAIIRHRPTQLSTIIRVGLFSMVGALAVVLGLVFAFSAANGPFDVMLAVIPAVIAFIFGTQGDLARRWMFWRWRWKNGSFHSQASEQQRTTSSTRLVRLNAGHTHTTSIDLADSPLPKHPPISKSSSSYLPRPAQADYYMPKLPPDALCHDPYGLNRDH